MSKRPAQWIIDLLKGKYATKPTISPWEKEEEFPDGIYPDLMTANFDVCMNKVTWSEVAIEGSKLVEENFEVFNPTSTVRTAVEHYRNLGLTPFPVCKPSDLQGRCYQHKNCSSPGKAPLAKAWTQIERNPLHDARIDQIFEQNDYVCNIGLRCGLDHGLIVLDIDGEQGRNDLESHGIDVFSMIGDYATVTTGRVGGYHIWFRPTDVTPTKHGLLKTHKIDLVGEGGFVVAPPSGHKGGNTYHFKAGPENKLFTMPKELTELFAKDLYPKVSCLPLTENARVKVGQRTLSFLENGASGNQREEAINAVVNLLGRGFDRDEIVSRVTEALINSPQLDPTWPWTEEDVEQMVSSFEKQGGPKPALALPEEPTLTLPQKKVYRTRLSARQFLETEAIADPEPVIEGLIDSGKLHWLWSQAGSGKTLWSLDMAYAIAKGEQYHGRSVTQGNVLLIERDSANQLHEYLELVQRAGSYDSEVLDKLYIATEEEAHFKDNEGVGYCLAIADELSDLRLVIVDAFYAVSPESAAWDARVLPFKRFKDAMANRGVATLVIDHAVKGANLVIDEFGNTINPLDALFGGTIKQAIFDIGMYWQGMLKDGAAKLQWAKLRTSARDGLKISFDEFDGFSVNVRLPDGNVWEGLSRREVEMVQYILDNGPTSWDKIATELNVPKAVVRRCYANKLMPRGVLTRQGDILQLGPHYTPHKEEPRLIIGDRS